MHSKKKDKDTRPTSFARSLLNKLKPSGSKPNAKQQHEGKNENPKGSVDTDLLGQSSTAAIRNSSAHQPKLADSANNDSKTSACARICDVILSTMGELAGISTQIIEEERSGTDSVREYCGILIKWIESLTIPEAMSGSLENLRSKLSRVATEDKGNSEDARWRVTNCLQMFVMENLVTGSIKMEKLLSDVQNQARDDILRQAVRDLVPRAVAAYNDATARSQSRTSCFEGTRVALLKEISKWLAESESNIYVLFGLAGIGKSTIAQTISEKADKIHLLGASFFFSRNEADRRTARMFFTTIAFQLCIYDPEFAVAIESVMLTEKGKGATTKLPLEQLKTLILEPLQKLTPRKVVVVVDALDECDDDDDVLVGLNLLVQHLPLFKIFLTTRPKQHPLLQTGWQSSQKVFHLQDIEDKIVNDDIERYLRHKLSLEEVKTRFPDLRRPWAASDEDIRSLVRGAGRLFIIASTTVLFLLDKTSTPASRMKMLRKELDQGCMRSSLNTLNDFYTVILRNAVPKDCQPDTVNFYQTIIGTIVLLQTSLPVSALATLINVEEDEVIALLRNLQSVILLGSNDIPVVYHKSFPDYIQDPARCKDEDLRIDLTFHHTRMSIQCFRLLNRCLKRNILDLGGPARFMDNYETPSLPGMHGYTDDHVQEKIPSELQYACSYLGNHIQSADEDADLLEELERFFDERFLYWLEALSWIEKLDTAHHTLATVQNLQKKQLSSSDLHRLVDDGQHFISKFYELIRRSALHTYHSALPLTPTETSLYMKYSKQLTFGQVQGGQKTWDAIVTNVTLGLSNSVNHVVFSQNSSLFACFINGWEIEDNFMTIHDAATGIPFGAIKGQVSTIANDFSKAAAFDDGSIKLYNVKKDVTPVAVIKPLATVVNLTLSPDGSRLVTGLEDGTIGLWDTEKCEQIESLGNLEKKSPVVFSSDASRIAFASCDEVVKLFDGTTGKIIIDLRFPGLEQPRLTFSGNGSRLACLAVEIESTLRVWNSHDGTLIGTAEDVGDTMAISTDGSLIATGRGTMLKLWNGNDSALLETPSLDLRLESWIECLEIHNDLLGIAFSDDVVALYDINSHAIIARLPFVEPKALAFSSDSSRLVAGSDHGEVRLWDVPSIAASDFTSQGESSKPTMLAFSPDCSRLASGHEDGTIKLWNTTNMAQVAVHKAHSKEVTALEFSVDGGRFASGSEDGIQLWNGEDGAPVDILECSVDARAQVSLSSSMLAIATEASIILWDLKTHSVIATLHQHGTYHLTFSLHNSRLAAAIKLKDDQYKLMVWEIGKYMPLRTFNLDRRLTNMRFLSDNSQLTIQCWDDSFHLLNLHDGRQSIVSETEAIRRLGLCPCWHGIPVWMSSSQIVGQFRQQEKAVVFHYHTVGGLQVEVEAEGSSMFALGCADGRILLIRAV